MHSSFFSFAGRLRDLLFGMTPFFEQVGQCGEMGEAGHAVFPDAVNGRVQAGDEEVWPCVNITPSAARRSACGECANGLPMQLRVS